MKQVFRSLIIALFIYFFHMSMYSLGVFLFKEPKGYYGFLGSLVYGLFFGFWAYWLLTFIYTRIISVANRRIARYGKAFVMIILGYFIARIPDIIDGDFFTKFNWWELFITMLITPVLVEIDILLNKSQKIKSVG